MEVNIAMMLFPDASIHCVLCRACGGQSNSLVISVRIIVWNLAIRSVEETTQSGWPTVSGRDIFISSHWGAALTGYWTILFPFIGILQELSRSALLIDVHILKGTPGLFSNPEVKLERVYWVVTWETSGEKYMTSILPPLEDSKFFLFEQDSNLFNFEQVLRLVQIYLLLGVHRCVIASHARMLLIKPRF